MRLVVVVALLEVVIEIETSGPGRPGGSVAEAVGTVGVAGVVGIVVVVVVVVAAAAAAGWRVGREAGAGEGRRELSPRPSL